MKRLLTLLFFILLIAEVYAQNLVPVDAGSAVKFVIKNFGFATPGSFSGLKGTIRFDAANIGSASFNVSINAATINTGNETRDKHLRKEDYFDVERYPLISFTSISISVIRPGNYLIRGRLTIKNITKEISFPFTATAQNNGYLFSGSFNMNRRDFTVGSSSMFLADNLEVTLSVFAK